MTDRSLRGKVAVVGKLRARQITVRRALPAQASGDMVSGDDLGVSHNLVVRRCPAVLSTTSLAEQTAGFSNCPASPLCAQWA
jgi:hypothetical protein